jgi:hypothetical protein
MAQIKSVTHIKKVYFFEELLFVVLELANHAQLRAKRRLVSFECFCFCVRGKQKGGHVVACPRHFAFHNSKSKALSSLTAALSISLHHLNRRAATIDWIQVLIETSFKSSL